MSYQNEQHQAEPTPVIGPGICEEVNARLLGNTLVTDLDPLSFFPQETPEDLEKLEARVEGWFNLITQLGELKAQPTFRIDPFNRVGLLYLRIEQYMLLLASPGCTQELKAQYWAEVEKAQNSQNEITPTVTVTLDQQEYGEDLFTATLAQVGEAPAYTRTGGWETCLKFCNQFWRVRRWNCSGWRFTFPKGDPLVFEAPETIALAITARIDDQKNDLLLSEEA